MKTLLLSDSFLPHAGGSRVYYYNLFKRLATQCGHQVTVLTKEVPGWQAFDAAESSPGFDILRRSKPAGNWKYREIHKLLRPLANTFGVIQKCKPDLVHVGDLYPQGVVALLLKHLRGTRYIAYCHGEEVTQMDRQRFEPRMRDAIYRNADAVIAASSFARHNLLRIGIPEHRIVKINPGVAYERFTPGPPQRDIVERLALQGKVVILTVARLVRRKGHANLLHAIARLAGNFRNIAYVVAGSGPEEKPLRALVQELGLTDVVKFAGYVPDDELPGYYRTCDLMAMTNCEDQGAADIEGFGMVFLEANAAGKAVLGGRSGGTAESVLDGVTGRLCDPYDVEDIARCLRSLIENPELREKMGQQGLERVHHEFNWDTRAARLHAFSRAVTSGSFNKSGKRSASEAAVF